MKKLIYSSLALFVASIAMVGCGDDNGGGGGGDTTPKGPTIEFQTNTGTFSGYTFA
ncbi:MAG: thiamine biosynthesis protein, partial [Bacteroidia bacterium]|nr:thiamine biosynthesis protein [Bacteroidia bacterium]